MYYYTYVKKKKNKTKIDDGTCYKNIIGTTNTYT